MIYFTLIFFIYLSIFAATSFICLSYFPIMGHICHAFLQMLYEHDDDIGLPLRYIEAILFVIGFFDI